MVREVSNIFRDQGKMWVFYNYVDHLEHVVCDTKARLLIVRVLHMVFVCT